MDLWPTVLDKISQLISKPSFETWIKSTTAEIHDDTLMVKAPNEFARDWLEERYETLIFDTVTELSGRSYTIEFICEGEPYKTEEITQHANHKGNNFYAELRSLIEEQSELLKAQQEKIETLEKRIQTLEQTDYVLVAKFEKKSSD